MKKLLLVSGLIFFIFFNTTRIYAYMSDSGDTYVTEENPVEIITQSMTTSHGKQLVPKDSILGVNDVEEIRFTYKVFVEEGKTLAITSNSLMVDGIVLSRASSDVFNFDFEQRQINKDSLTTSLFEPSERGTFIEVTLRLSMDMPSYETYQEIAGGTLKFDVMFEAK